MNKFIFPLALGALAAAVLMSLTYLVATWVGVDDAGSYFSLAQLGVDIVLGPAVLYSLYLAIDASRIAQESLRVSRYQLDLALEEVRRLEAKPEVDLFFEGNVKEAELVKPRNPFSFTEHDLILFNSGTTIARWYSVDFQIPAIFYLDPSDIPKNTYRNKWVWRNGYASFQSDGTGVIYLNHPFYLIRLNLYMSNRENYQERYEIPYVIANDWGSPKEGKLILRVVDESTNA